MGLAKGLRTFPEGEERGPCHRPLGAMWRFLKTLYFSVFCGLSTLPTCCPNIAHGPTWPRHGPTTWPPTSQNGLHKPTSPILGSSWARHRPTLPQGPNVTCTLAIPSCDRMPCLLQGIIWHYDHYPSTEVNMISFKGSPHDFNFQHNFNLPSPGHTLAPTWPQQPPILFHRPPPSMLAGGRLSGVSLEIIHQENRGYLDSTGTMEPSVHEWFTVDSG
jgi:hypothetical protein